MARFRRRRTPRIVNRRKFVKGAKLKKKGKHLMVAAVAISRRAKRRAHRKISRRRG